MKLMTVIGTRPEIIKMSCLIELFNKKFDHILVHTGQHYDPELDNNIFADLKLARPKVRLKTGSGSFSGQLSKLSKQIEETYLKHKPDYVVVQGDTNTAFVGALVAARLKIKVIHVEAGARSGNVNAPEEQNRKMIDTISTYYFSSDKQSYLNLKREGRSKNLFNVGSTLFDSLKRSSKLAPKNAHLDYNLQKERFVLLTLHRAENTNDIQIFLNKINFINKVAKNIPILFSIHPRTKKLLRKLKIKLGKNIIIDKPLPHLTFLSLLKNCRFVLTDSGGVQEEAAFFNRPCLILRNETEWMRLINAKKNFLLKKLDKKALNFVEKVIFDDKFYQKIRSRKGAESVAGASRMIIKKLSQIK